MKTQPPKTIRRHKLAGIIAQAAYNAGLTIEEREAVVGITLNTKTVQVASFIAGCGCPLTQAGMGDAAFYDPDPRVRSRLMAFAQYFNSMMTQGIAPGVIMYGGFTVKVVDR